MSTTTRPISTNQSNSRKTLTVEEAARELGIGRGLAYEAARTTGNIAGVPVLRVGRRMLIGRAALERVLVGREPEPAA